MATAPQPPRPPVPPSPPRKRGHTLAIVLLALAVIILVSVVTILTGLRFLSRNVQVHVNKSGGGEKEVSIKSPFGSIEVNKDANEATLGLPIYPGSTRLKGEDNATMNLQFGGEQGVRVVVAKFETPDALKKVEAFYQTRLSGEVTRFVEKDSEGKTVFEIKKGDNEKVVALKSTSPGTRIELVHVRHGRRETN